MLRIVLLAAGLVIGVGRMSGASANELRTGADLRTVCSSGVDADRMACVVYIKGARDMMSFYTHFEPNTVFKACEPPGTSLGQLVATVLSYLERRPQFLYTNPASVVSAAMTDIYPCQRSR